MTYMDAGEIPEQSRRMIANAKISKAGLGSLEIEADGAFHGLFLEMLHAS